MLRATAYALMSVTIFIFIMALALSWQVKAHSWYPPECCSGQDCAEITHIDLKKGTVSTKHGTAPITASTKRLESKDNKSHACILGGRTICLFLAPQT